MRKKTTQQDNHIILSGLFSATRYRLLGKFNRDRRVGDRIHLSRIGSYKKEARIPLSLLSPLYLWLSDYHKKYGEANISPVVRAVKDLIETIGPYLPLPEPISLQRQEPVLEKLPRPRSVRGQTIEMSTVTYGHLYFVLNWVDGKPFEIFAYIGKNGSDQQATAEGVCRLASLAFRYGIDAMEVADQLRGIQSSSPEWSQGEQIKSLEDAISKAIKQGLEEGDPTL